MNIEENHTVRHLRLILNDIERSRYNKAMTNFITQDIYAETRRSGPLINDNGKVVPNKFLYIVDIQEDYADEFLKHLEGE